MTAKPVKRIYVLITAIILAIAVTLLTSFYLAKVEPGYKDYGFPLAWKRIYGEVIVEYDYFNFVFNVFGLTVTIFLLLFVVFKYGLGWKPS